MTSRRTLLRAVPLLLVAQLGLAGCATSGKTYTEARDTLPPLPPDHGRLLIYRSIVLGAAVQPAVLVNGVPIGNAVPRGFHVVDRPAGDYEIKTTTEVTRTLTLTLTPGQTRFVRLNISIGFFVGHVYPELVEDAEGVKEIADLRMIGG